MADLTDLGAISSAISSGIRAANSIDRGPIILPSTSANRTMFSDLHLISSPTDLFIAGFHKWGDPAFKVAK